MKIVSYEKRVSNMHEPGDEDKQLQLAKNYVKALRRKMKRSDNLKDKLTLLQAEKEAKAVLRQLRVNIFELQDMLDQRIQ